MISYQHFFFFFKRLITINTFYLARTSSFLLNLIIICGGKNIRFSYRLNQMTYKEREEKIEKEVHISV